VGEISHLLLQCSDLGLQGAQLLWQREQVSRQRRDLAGKLGRFFLLRGSQMAMMQAGKLLQVLLAQPFFAAIDRMALKGERSLLEPAVQRFGIDAQASGRLSQRDEGHQTTPFVWWIQQEREQA